MLQRNLFMKDKELLENIMKNPSEGIETALNIYGGAIKTICINILGNESKEDVEECISDVFLELWKNAARVNCSKGSLKSYIYGIARHKAVDRVRRKVGKQETFMPEEVELSVEIDFADELARKKNAKILQETIDGLPSPDKEIFIYRYYFYEKIKDIAERLALPPKTVENKLLRGKKALKKQLIERGIVL